MVRSDGPLKDLPGIAEIRRLYEAGKVSKREATRRVEAVVKDCGVCSWHAGPLDEYVLFGHSNKFPEIIGESQH